MVGYLSSSAVGPHASAAVLVEVEPGGAGYLDGLAVDAVVEDVAGRGVRMGEEAVLPGTLFTRLRWLCNLRSRVSRGSRRKGAINVEYILTELESVAAVDVEYVVALVDLAIQGVEDQTVGTVLLDRQSVDALVELVALPRVLVLAVLLRTSVSTICVQY